MPKSTWSFLTLFLLAVATLRSADPAPQIADQATYLENIGALCRVDWPKNRAVTIVFHGHSVPAGYFKTPEIHSLQAYPNQIRVLLADKYPHAVINVIVTAIGGEQSEHGAKRFERDVLSLHPDVVMIDYAVNDVNIGLERARKAWVAMIEQAQAQQIKVILLTPTPTLATKFDDPKDPLNQHAEQIRALAKQYHVGLVDSLAAFADYAHREGNVAPLMSQFNHPNEAGHRLVSGALIGWFR